MNKINISEIAKDVALRIWGERSGSETPDAQTIDFAAYMFMLGVGVGQTDARAKQKGDGAKW